MPAYPPSQGGEAYEESIAVSDEVTALIAGIVATFRASRTFTLTKVKASLTSAGTGASLLTIQITKNGTNILSTPITIDAGETTSETATTPPVISDSSIADDDEIKINITQIDTNNTSTGLKIYLLGHL